MSISSTCAASSASPLPPRPIPRARTTASKGSKGEGGFVDVWKRGCFELRERWLNPPEWIEQVAAKVDAADDFADVPAPAHPLIRRSAIMALAAKDSRLKKRTLTNLYNGRPNGSSSPHEKLDRAVLAAYAATDPEGEWLEDWAKVWVDSGAGQPLPEGHPVVAERSRVDQRVLGHLLELNGRR